MTKEEVLKQCTVHENIVKLPDRQLDRILYLQVKKDLELIGGKWKGGKTSGFVFNEDPTNLLLQIACGEKRDLKKEFQFFPTPDELAQQMVKYADLHSDCSVLEPSAGQGAIIKAIHAAHPDLMVYCYEIMPVNKTFLSKLFNVTLLGSDFLHDSSDMKFDRIIANPPFNKNQDIAHIHRMYELLEDGGRIVTVSSRHWLMTSNRTETNFREWLKTVKPEIIELPAGTFKESGTEIETMLLIINKPKSK